MNSVYISGLVKGEAQRVKDDNVVRIVTTQDNKGNSKEFKVHSAAGEYADKLAGVPSGKRIILEGRFSNEELEAGSEVYQGVISLVKIIAVTEASMGVDHSKGYISGVTNAKTLNQTASGTAVANLNVKNQRSFFSKKQNKEISLSTYVNVVAWTEKAKGMEHNLPMTDKHTESSGLLVPGEYESTKHPGVMVSKIELWADDITVVDGGVSSAPAARPAPAPRSAPKPPKKGGVDSDLGF